MGTHPNGPASLYHEPDTSLKSLVAADPTYFLGSRTASKYSTVSQDKQPSQSPEIPFLFKALSVAKALPLQAHPDVALAQKLNTKDGKRFVDANHKPEIALALGNFRGFVGFKPLDEIRKAIDETPELKGVIGKDISFTNNRCLRAAISSLLLQPQTQIEETVQKLVKRLKTESKSDPLSRLVSDVDTQYPGDVGVLIAPYFMNLVTLAKGDAIYIGVDEAHAYLDGDIMECMTISDNVVNAAFVPPAERDPRTFLEMLTYSPRPAPRFKVSPKRYMGGTIGLTTAYDPQLEEFIVLRTKLDGVGDKEEELSGSKGPTIGIVVRGHVQITVESFAEEFNAGSVFFVAAEKAILLRTTHSVEIFWATLAKV